jgi:ADP-ribose pyrophosphatase YjhB (NUDIX family)
MIAATGLGGADRVELIERCRLAVGTGRWAFAETHAAAIDAHWARRSAANPAMFNGTVYILGAAQVAAGTLSGALMATDFKSFLYWKDHGYPDSSVRDVFGSALILSAEGHVVLGQQAAGNLNSGLAYLPGGFIDTRDVDEEGHVDIAASVAREVAEETGLDPDLLERQPGFLLTHAGPMTSIAVAFRSAETSDALQAKIRAHIAADAGAAELADAVVIRSAADLAGLAAPRYADVLLAHLLAQDWTLAASWALSRSERA